MKTTKPFRLFITTTVGFEKELMSELQPLARVHSLMIGKGGVWAEVAHFKDVIYLNYVLRTANRVLLELVSIEMPEKRDIYNAIASIDWTLFFKNADETFCIEVPFSAHSEFRNTLFAAQFMKDPICDRLRKERRWRPSINTETPDVRFQAFLTEEKFNFYIDTSREPLFKRGYRTDDHHVAPLKETLAAALLLRAKYNPEIDVVLDPCAGSGTFIMEALMMRFQIAPGILRKEFGFLLHPQYDIDEDRLERYELTNLSSKLLESAKDIRHIGIEKDPVMYRAMLQSIAKIGCMNRAAILNRGFQAMTAESLGRITEAAQPTLLITNPPYGVRMKSSQDSLYDLYRSLGYAMKDLIAPGGRSAVILPQTGDFQRSIGLRSSHRSFVLQGGIDCAFVQYDIR